MRVSRTITLLVRGNWPSARPIKLKRGYRVTSLIHQLKQEHAAIMHLLKKVAKLGVTNGQALKELISAKTLLLEHLRKEDELLYPVLRASAGMDPALMHTIDRFADDMDVVSAEAIAFFDKYSTGGHSLEFSGDFGFLAVCLESRIRKEEAILYEEYLRAEELSSIVKQADMVADDGGAED